MANLQDFEPGLAEWVSAAAQQPARSWADVYRLYAGPVHTGAVDEHVLRIFLQGLVAVGRCYKKTVHLQGNAASFRHLVDYYVHGKNPGVKLPPAAKLWRAYYHLTAANYERADIGKRLYLHVAAPVMANSMAILHDLVPQLDTIPGLLALKLSGPGGHQRRDHMVIYLRDDAALTAVLEQLRAPGQARRYAAGVPKAVYEVAPGIGLVNELPRPPAGSGVSAATQDLSFGSFLARIIWDVLRAWRAASERSFEDYLYRIQQALRAAGIDPLRPYSATSQKTPLPPAAALGRVLRRLPGGIPAPLLWRAAVSTGKESVVRAPRA